MPEEIARAWATKSLCRRMFLQAAEAAADWTALSSGTLLAERFWLPLAQRGGENAGERILTRTGEQQAQGQQQLR